MRKIQNKRITIKKLSEFNLDYILHIVYWIIKKGSRLFVSLNFFSCLKITLDYKSLIFNTLPNLY